jgi:C4-dicarboxylate-specific signal transduction histidine kinase
VLAEQALHRSQVHLAHVTRVTMLGEMAASIAHEVNQPLAAISANGQACLRWLGRPQPEVDEARAAVASLLDASARATDVISSIRALARKSEPQHLALDLSAVAVEAVELVRRELASHQIALMLELAGDLPPVCGDRVQLQQVMINLMMNAMQAMQSCAPGQAVLTVQTERAGDGAVQFSVSDSGPGISPLHLPKLFDAFFSSRADGMGMGLAICRSIVDAHGGRIWAHSPPGAGATFQFSLPVQPVVCA